MSSRLDFIYANQDTRMFCGNILQINQIFFSTDSSAIVKLSSLGSTVHQFYFTAVMLFLLTALNNPVINAVNSELPVSLKIDLKVILLVYRAFKRFGLACVTNLFVFIIHQNLLVFFFFSLVFLNTNFHTDKIDSGFLCFILVCMLYSF